MTGDGIFFKYSYHTLYKITKIVAKQITRKCYYDT